MHELGFYFAIKINMSNRRLINFVCMLTITGFCMGVATGYYCVHVDGVVSSNPKTMPRCIERERQALLNFKQGLQMSDSFLSWEEEDCCLWYGIGCNCETGHVTMITVGSSFLTGEIRPSLLELRYLNYLDLSGNNFNSKKFPEFFGLFTNLMYLDLSSIGFRGSIPDTFGNMTSLSYLDLSSCGFRGSIPDTFGNLTSLSELDLSSNLLQGRIPKSLGDLCNLQRLDLSDNNFSQQISETLLNLMGCAQDSLKMLRFSGNKFRGSIPDTFGNMTSLKELDLSSNLLQGGIPKSLGDLCKLRWLDLSNNIFSQQISQTLLNLMGCAQDSLERLRLSGNQFGGGIPDTFGNMTSLVHLNLSSNLLQGGIPKSFGDFCKLQRLDLSDNNFSQQISEALPNLMGCAQDFLLTLRLSRNQFKGPLPSQVARFSSLRHLYLDSNQLNGSLPESLGKVSSLRILVASSNSLSGVISEAHVSNLSNLQQLDLSFNSLLTLKVSSTAWVPSFQLVIIRLASCKLGPHFPSWLRTHEGFVELDISNSQISHPIPDWFWTNLSSDLLHLNLSFNHIPGTLPNLEWDKFYNFPTVDLSSNLFNGPIPRFLLTTLLLNLSKNMFSGSIKSFLCSMTAQGMNYLDLSDNQLSGNLPVDCWFPLNETLSILNLENNNFSGTIPTSMGSLSLLETLCLRNNSFSGQLPLSLKGWQRLKLLDIGDNYFSGKIPSWIGESLKGLVVLRLASNGFHGDIPLNICHLQSLGVLDLSLNKISGSIPSCLNNFTAIAHNDPLAPGSTYIPLPRSNVKCGGAVSARTPPSMIPKRRCSAYSFKLPIGNFPIAVNNVLFTWKGTQRRYGKNLGLLRAIDLSSNTLIGEIPGQVTSLTGLRALNLSRNQLNGTIPTNIGQLELLESLDLSMNRLGGGLPDDLSKLSYLSYLDLSNNVLSGKIPSSTQLQSFNATSYIGNSQLCGPPLLNQCPVQDHPRFGTGENSQQSDKWFEGLWFYTGMASGFTSGLLGVCGALLLNTSWRRAYFDFLTTMWDSLYVTAVVYKARFQRQLQELI